MAPRLLIDWAPAYEMLISFHTYARKPAHRFIESGTDWIKRANDLMPQGFSEQAEELDAITGVPTLLVAECPGERTPEGFLNWLADLPADELYRRIAAMAGLKGRTVPPDLPALRDRYVAVLTLWAERYFPTVDPAILKGLAAEAEAQRAAAQQIGLQDLVEAVTGGIRLEGAATYDTVGLVPQYHMAPMNLLDCTDRTYGIMYPFDPLPPNPGEVPRALRRLVRALDDDSRLRILRFLAGEPATSADVVRFTGLAKSTVHHHMVALRTAGLVLLHVRQDATERYSLRPDTLDRLGPQLRTFLEGE